MADEMDLADGIGAGEGTDASQDFAPDGGGEAGAAESQASAALDAAPAPAETASETPAAPAFTIDSPEFQEAIEQRAAQMVDLRLEQIMQGYQPDAAAAAPQQEQGFDWTQLDPLEEGFGQQLGAGLTSTIGQMIGELKNEFQQMLSPVLAREEQGVVAEGEQRMKDILADIASREGEFNTAAAEKVSRVFFQEAQQQYGATPRAAEVALHRASKFVREIEQAAFAKGKTAAENGMATLAGAPREPAGAGAGAVLPLTEGGDELTVDWRKYANA